MEPRRAWWITALATASSLAWANPVARADERTDARREFRAGMQAVADGRYDEGVEHLERAYDILPHPNVLYNVGLAHMYAGRSELALEYFERYRETAPPGDQSEVDTLIRQLEAARAPSPEAAPVATDTTREPGAEVASTQTLGTLEASAREVRRLAEERNSDALRRQADDLDRAVVQLRARQAEQALVTPAQSTSPEGPDKLNQIPLPSEQTSEQTPPTSLPTQGTARTGLYEEQVVSASRFSQSPLDAPNATAIITAQDIRMTGAQNMTTLLRRVAGIELNNFTPSHSEISIRGLNRRGGTKVLVLWDGRPIRKDLTGTNWIDSLPISLEDVERIEIIRGPASALYGADAFSGIINIISRAPGAGQSFVFGRGGNKHQMTGGATFVGREGKLRWRYSSDFQRFDNAVLISNPSRLDVRPATDAPDRGTVGILSNGELSYQIADDSVATAGASLTFGDITTNGQARIGQVSTDNSYDMMTWANVTTPIGLRIGAWYEYIYALSAPSFSVPAAVAPPRGNVAKQHQGEIDLSWTSRFKALFPQTLTLGATYRAKHITWDWLDDTHTQNHVGGYLQDIIQLAEPLRLQVGARVDRHPLLSGVQFSPRGSLVYRFLGEQSLRLSAGRAFRSPTFLESYLKIPNETPLRGVTAWGVGNPNIDPERITSLELGYQNQQSDYFALEANVYYNWVKDAILLTAVDRYNLRDFANGRNGLAGYVPEVEAFPVSALSFANERATYRQIGGELGVRLFPIRGLDLYTNYAIHDTAPTDKKKVDVERANEQQTSVHKINGGFQYRAPFGMELSADVSWMSKQRWVEQVTDTERGVRWEAYKVDSLVYVIGRIGWRLLGDRLELGVVGTNLAFQHKRQHPYAQPLDTRVLGSVKVWF